MKLLRVKLQTSDLELVEQFYCKQLGLKGSKTEGELLIEIGSTLLVFHPSDENDKPYYHFAINIPKNQLTEAISYIGPFVSLLKVNSVGDIIADFRNWNAKSVYFIDPVGNIVELIAQFNLSNQSSAAFSAKSFLSISEIGLVVNIVKSTITEFAEHYGIDIFVPSTSTEQFAALGNDEGLFILSEANRNWYPTQMNAKAFALEVKFETDDNVVFDFTN
ncbi:hypothetical protein NF867_08815 [Solitalea sp. MAHUQ-68]|uniref:VOC domain-containing protein n=1 Tax=Solitalea agri TaxID=2953739 RepID=A0A9X2JF19_9SPHI|nr:hypothetical protein [Solitalea agri]MCO4292961.1 hypothetical protein [Solitalea agri]